MEKLADKLAGYIMNKGIIEEEDFASYHYGIQTGIELLICLVASTAIACIYDVFAEFLIVLFVLFPLRAYICGVHMRKFSTCFICSVVFVTYGPMLVKHITLSRWLLLFLCIGLMFLIHKFAFITTRYQCDQKEVDFFAKQRRKILLCVMILLLIFFVFDVPQFMKQIVYALLVAFGSLVAEVIRIAIIQYKAT